MVADDLGVVDIYTGEKLEVKWKPSPDTVPHLELYKRYQSIAGVVHTHYLNTVAFIRVALSISALGTTHADYFYGDIPVHET